MTGRLTNLSPSTVSILDTVRCFRVLFNAI